MPTINRYLRKDTMPRYPDETAMSLATLSPEAMVMFGVLHRMSHAILRDDEREEDATDAIAELAATVVFALEWDADEHERSTCAATLRDLRIGEWTGSRACLVAMLTDPGRSRADARASRDAVECRIAEWERDAADRAVRGE